MSVFSKGSYKNTITFCDNKMAGLVLDFVNNKSNKKDIAKIKLFLTNCLEQAFIDKDYYPEEFIIRFTDALFSNNPKEGLQEVFAEFCREGVLFNKKLYVLFCTDFDSLIGHCYDFKLSFHKTVINAVKSTYINPKTFARKNNINFEKIWESYTNWYMGSGQCNEHVYKEQISGSLEFIKLCDFFGIKVKKVKDPYDWWQNRSAEPGFEYDMKKVISESSKEECRYFSRWFSKNPKNWFDREEEDWFHKF